MALPHTIERGERSPERSAWLTRRPRYRPDIEGLRAVAVFIVVAFHAGVPGFEGGFIGVDVFFVLSGYLITWLLVNEAEREGGIDLARFYARRARRLLPAMAVVLLGTLVVMAWLYAPFEQRSLARTWATTALYVSNVDFAYRAVDYHGAGAETNPLLHTWSLSVEEQFYLVWPWLVLFGLGLVSRRRAPDPRRLLLVLGVTTALSFALALYLTHAQGVWAFYLSPTRAWEFGAGGLAVLVPASRWPRRKLNPARPEAVTGLLSWGALLALGAATTLYGHRTPFPGVAALVPVLATVVLLRAGGAEEAGSVNRLLSLRPLQAVGKLSYSWYLWHWPALVFAAALGSPLPLSGRLAVAGASLVPAYASHTFVENPLRHSRWLSERPTRSLAMAGAIAVSTVALAVVWLNVSTAWSLSGEQAHFTHVWRDRADMHEDGCDHFGASAEATECVYGNAASSRTVALVGDSHAAQFFPAVRAAAEEAGWKMVVLTRSSCPFVDLSDMAYEFGSYNNCYAWRSSAIEVLGRLAPDVTFVGTDNGYDVDPGAWEAGTRSSLSRLARVSDHVVLILDPPYAGINIPSCLARAAWRPGDGLDPDCTPVGGTPAVLELAAAQERAARSVSAIATLDIRDEVCVIGECGPTSAGLIRYRDDHHLSLEFAATFKSRFLDILHATEEAGGAAR